MAAAAVPLINVDGVRAALAVCGASIQQRNAIVSEGFTSMADLTILDEKEVTDMMNNITKLPAAHGGVRIGAILTKKVKALVYWTKERQRTGKELDANEFTVDVLAESIERMGLDATTDDSKPELPTTKFDPNRWVSWIRKFENYLWQVKGRNNTPLIYVIRKVRDMATPFASVAEERIYQVSHRGQAFDLDNKKVYEILTQLLSGTLGWTWISAFDKTKNGKEAVKTLRDHYDGPGAVEKRLAYAYNILKEVHYKSERQFNFESYVTKLSEAFEVLTENGVSKTEREKVDYLLDGMVSDNQVIITAKTTVRMHTAMKATFQIAVDKLSELIGVAFKNTGQKSPMIQGRQGRQISAMRGGYGPGRGRGGRGRGGGRGGRGRGRGNEKYWNGIDITDMTRQFTPDEWNKISESPDMVKKVQEAREARKARKRAKVSSVETDNSNNDGGGDRDAGTPSNGSGFGAGAYPSSKKANNNKE